MIWREVAVNQGGRLVFFSFCFSSVVTFWPLVARLDLDLSEHVVLREFFEQRHPGVGHGEEYARAQHRNHVFRTGQGPAEDR